MTRPVTVERLTLDHRIELSQFVDQILGQIEVLQIFMETLRIDHAAYQIVLEADQQITWLREPFTNVLTLLSSPKTIDPSSV